MSVAEATQWTQRPHQHKFFELGFIEEGEGLPCANYQQFPYQRRHEPLLPPIDCYSFRIRKPTRFVFLRSANQMVSQHGSGKLDLEERFQKLSYMRQAYAR